MEDGEILAGFIKQYYMDNPNIPNKIMLREELAEKRCIRAMVIHNCWKGKKWN